MDYFSKTSSRVKVLTESALSEILRVAAKKEIISLAGGLPAPEVFPLSIIRKLSLQVIDKYQSLAFQYGPTDGSSVLKEAIVSWLKERKIKANSDEIGITTGSQAGLDALGRIFIDKNDYIAVEAPTYIGAVDAFSSYQPRYLLIETDDQGVIPESLERILKRKKIKFIYLVPTFQNPTGRTISWERRIKIAELIKKYKALLIEDDPYYSLRYEGKFIPPIKTLVPENTVYLSSFSKVLAPGLRLGFYVAPKTIGKLMVAAKQAVDLHTNSFAQLIAAEYLKTGHLKNHLPKILKIYKSRRDAMLSALKKYFPSSFRFTYPKGGMFIWVEGPSTFDAVDFYWQKAIVNNVAFVPGTYFFMKRGMGKNTMRLNFTNVNEEKIEKSIAILGQLLKKKYG